MDDTLSHVAIEISKSNSSFALWDCAQAIVTLSRTKHGKNRIFVGVQNYLHIGTEYKVEKFNKSKHQIFELESSKL